MLVPVTAPATKPVSLAEAKAYLYVDHDADDALIESLIATATDHLDGPRGLLGRALVEQRWELRLPRFPRGAIEIPLPPCIAIVSVTYLDPEEVEQALAPGDLRLVGLGGDEPAQLWPTLSTPWPATADHPEAVKVRFDAGYGSAADVPDRLKSAILAHVSTLYQTREIAYLGPASFQRVPAGYADLIAPFQRWRFT